MIRTAVIGAGSWGTAIAVQLAKKHPVIMWEYDLKQVESIRKDRENKKFLPGVKLPDNITIYNDLKYVIPDAEAIFFVVPSQYLRETARACSEYNLTDKHIISLVKGLEKDTAKRMSEILKETIKRYLSLSVLSGPSHAEEVAKNLPAAVILASESKKIKKLIEEFSTETFRIYLSHDITGVEYCAAIKNIIAIAAGICDGLNLGTNAKSALLTRGMEEIRRFIKKTGGDIKTVNGLAGIGDLMTTCFSQYSRNRYVGEQIAKNNNLEKILSEMIMVAEGVSATEIIYKIANKLKIEMPITETVYRILFEKNNPSSEVSKLMLRPYKKEFSL